MWYVIDIDDGILAKTKTKKEGLIHVNCINIRCKKLSKGAYTIEQKDETDITWGEIAYIFASKELAEIHGFGWCFENGNKNN